MTVTSENRLTVYPSAFCFLESRSAMSNVPDRSHAAVADVQSAISVPGYAPNEINGLLVSRYEPSAMIAMALVIRADPVRHCLVNDVGSQSSIAA
jgi:hypothetical protein